MKSRLPKSVAPIGRACTGAACDRHRRGLKARHVVVITSHGAAEVEDALTLCRGRRPAATFVRQEPQLGTNRTVQQAVPVLPDDGDPHSEWRRAADRAATARPADRLTPANGWRC